MFATITYHCNSQKIPGLFSSLLTSEILEDITYRVTGQKNYNVIEIKDGYNHGRLITLDYLGVKHYVSLSETHNAGRNSSLQSVPTAANIFYSDFNPNKKLYFYFLPHEGNLFTDYHLLYYRMMLTAGFIFLNLEAYSPYCITPYSDIDTLIQERNENRNSNRGNNSSFVTRTADRVQVYAKVFGANKYESTLLGIALRHITQFPIDLFAVAEQDLVDLPKSSKRTLNLLGVNLYQTTLKLTPSLAATASVESLRDAAYNYNLLYRIGYKRCAVCGCLIPALIQGAHIWPVSDIKQASGLGLDIKYQHAISGHNGIWLCQNHHKLFDSDLMVINNMGEFMVRKNLPSKHIDFIRNSTTETHLAESVLSDEFRNYLNIRNATLNFNMYERVCV